ncbi:outer membrane beta-barrel protein [Falsiroseomonas sp. HW251]|uniref:outer membrane beta-barrel protein n=1 Tax=Falsiroseomonas sp. HW251 TaxID=3390998 RepID=UPI003D3133B1
MRAGRQWIIAGLGALLLPLPAGAQDVPRVDTQRGVTVSGRARPDYDPVGIRLGGFRADAAAEIGAGYDSNILGNNNGRLSDGFASLGAEAGVRSDWSTHALGVTGRVLNRTYASEGQQDWTDFAVGLYGRYDFTPYTSVSAAYNLVQEHLSASSIDVQEAGLARPVPYYYNEFNVQAQTRLNRLGFLALANWRGYRFSNVDAGPAAVPGQLPPGDVSVFDFDSIIGAVGTSYELSPGRFVNATLRYQNINYSDASQSPRDSNTWEGTVGFTYDFDGVWGFNGEVGYLQRDYSGAGIKTLSAPAFRGTLTWQPTLLTSVSAFVGRSVRESIRDNAVSYTATVGSLRVDHEYLRNVIVGAEAGVEWDQYQQPSQSSTDAYGAVSARWLINRSFSLVGSYQYSWRLNASAGLPDYNRNLVQFSLRMAL